MDAAALSRRARHGDAQGALPGLLALAGDPAAGDAAWRAAAGAVQIMFWRDRFVDAADLAENVILSLADAGTALSKQDTPFDDALVAAQVHADVPAAPRLRRLAGALPAGSTLADRLAWLAGRLDDADPATLLPNHRPWGGPAATLGVVGQNLMKQRYQKLKENQRRALWGAVESANDIAAARQIVAGSREDPPTYSALLWLAGWYVHDGAVEPAERLLRAAAGAWTPYADWDCVPTAPVLQPVLRRAVTAPVREYYLTTGGRTA